MLASGSYPLDIAHGTTVLSIRKEGEVVIACDGQVTIGATQIKSNARKVRRLGNGRVLAGFAGVVADSLALFERLESKLNHYPNNLMRSCVELAKDWRDDKYLRRLETVMAVVDRNVSFIITGNGDILEPEDGMIGIGSGGAYALAAARALYDQPFSAEMIAEKSMKVAADLCIYTNHNFIFERLP